MAEYASLDVDLSKILPAGQHWRDIDELREQHRFFWNREAQGYWVLTQYDDIREAFNQPEVFGNHSIVATEPEPQYRFLPSFSDPPQHMKYRHLMNRWFAPAAVRAHVPRIEVLARETIAPLVPLGRTDVMRSFGDEYPVRVFLLSMGLDDADADFFVSCVRRRSGANHATPEGAARIMSAWQDLSAYWTDCLAARRNEPLDPGVDMVSHLLRCELDGAPLPDADILDICVTLTIGSLDTLKSQLGWCLYHLATHPDDRRRLVAEPELVPSAVEELLRAYSIIPMARKLTRDIDFHGCPMKKDDMVLLTIPAATRDPRQFDDPERVVLDRSPNRHIAFGASEHRCLGSHLARVELQIALRTWLEQIPEFRLDRDSPPPAHGRQITLLELPLVWP